MPSHGQAVDDGVAPTPAEDWAKLIAAQPPLSRQAAGPAQSRWLTFRDKSLERAYLQFEYERSKRVIVIGFFVGALIQLAFVFVLDPLLAPPEQLKLLTSTRLWILMPAVLGALIGSTFITDVRVWIPFESTMLFIGGCWLVTLVVLSDGALFDPAAMGLWNLVVIGFFICGLPLLWSAGVCLVCGLAFAMSAGFVQLTDQQASTASANFAMMYLFSAFATYRYERATRLQFVAQGMSQLLAERRLAIEADRRKWLEVIAAFLRHELNNAMTAISSSVDMAERAAERAKLAKFLGRARRSTLFMRRLLTQVADATSLESALVRETFESINFSELARDRVSEFHEDHSQLFQAAFHNDVHVEGNADALTQMLDKLLTNAIEHARPGTAIGVDVQIEGDVCILVVEDEGDALPSEVEALFRPFVSKKTRRLQGANLGLGLFVARTIARHHGGALTATPLQEGRTGARFVVQLPLGAQPAAGVSARHPAIAATALGPDAVEGWVNA